MYNDHIFKSTFFNKKFIILNNKYYFVNASYYNIDYLLYFYYKNFYHLKKVILVKKNPII